MFYSREYRIICVGKTRHRRAAHSLYFLLNIFQKQGWKVSSLVKCVSNSRRTAVSDGAV